MRDYYSISTTTAISTVNATLFVNVDANIDPKAAFTYSIYFSEEQDFQIEGDKLITFSVEEPMCVMF